MSSQVKSTYAKSYEQEDFQVHNISKLDGISIPVALKSTIKIKVDVQVEVRAIKDKSELKSNEYLLSSTGKVQLISSQQIKANNNNIHVVSFYSIAIDTKVYNVMFVFSSKGKMIIGSFTCISSLQKQWQNSTFQIIRSLKNCSYSYK